MSDKATEKTYLVVHPKVNLKVKLEGDEKAKVQKVPVGTEVTMALKEDCALLKSGKLKLKTAAKKATASK